MPAPLDRPETAVRCVVVVPVKPPALGKSRLVGLTDEQRRELAEAFALDTVAAARATTGVEAVLVVTDDFRLATALRGGGVEVMPDGVSEDLNETLVQAAAEVGLDADDIRRRLATDEDVARISADAKEAADKGISGVPTYVFAGKYAVSGAQPAEQLARAIRQVSAEVNAEAAE